MQWRMCKKKHKAMRSRPRPRQIYTSHVPASAGSSELLGHHVHLLEARLATCEKLVKGISGSGPPEVSAHRYIHNIRFLAIHGLRDGSVVVSRCGWDITPHQASGQVVPVEDVASFPSEWLRERCLPEESRKSDRDHHSESEQSLSDR